MYKPTWFFLRYKIFKHYSLFYYTDANVCIWCTMSYIKIRLSLMNFGALIYIIQCMYKENDVKTLNVCLTGMQLNSKALGVALDHYRVFCEILVQRPLLFRQRSGVPLAKGLSKAEMEYMKDMASRRYTNILY